MNFCGIICEFNPFHNGHEYIIGQTAKMTGKEIVCLMSGDFVQRGKPAIMDKYDRARCAILAGASMVVELPTVFACSNAENFALGAIKTLKGLGVDTLAFGVEHASIEILQKIAKIKFENSEKFTEAFKNEIENGINFNTAQKRAIVSALGEDVSEVLNQPNNILAIEYLTAILKLHAKITPIAIERCDQGYYSNTSSGEFLSASGVRELMENRKNYSEYVPKYAKFDEILTENAKSVLNALAIKTLRDLPAKQLEKCYDYSEGIEFRVKKCAEESADLEKIIRAVSTARYRPARVNKLVLYPLLNITKATVEKAKKCKPVAKVLAVSKSKKHLLSTIDKSKINLIVTNKDYDNLSAVQKQVIEVDLNASNIYNLMLGKQFNLDKKTGSLFV